MGPRRTALLPGDAATYARDANHDVLVITQVEPAEAIENLDELLAGQVAATKKRMRH